MTFAKEFPELLEVTHFHAYIEGVVLLVLAHLFVAVPLSGKLKMGVVGLSFGSTLIDLGSPWAIRYLSPYAAYGQISAWVGMSLGYLLMIFFPFYYLWKSPPPLDHRRKAERHS